MSEKVIERVIVSEDCYETCPCQHDVTVYYLDGSTEKFCLFAEDILENYSDFLTENQKEHLAE